MKVRYTGDSASGITRRVVMSGVDISGRVLDLRVSGDGSFYSINRRGRSLGCLCSANGSSYVFNFPNYTVIDLGFTELVMVNNQYQYNVLNLSNFLPEGVVGNRHIFSIRYIFWGVNNVKDMDLLCRVGSKYEIVLSLSEEFGLPERSTGVFEFYTCPVLDISDGELPFKIGLRGQGSCFIGIFGQYEESYVL